MMMRSVGQKNGEAGSALVEFALASVIVLTVLFGIIDMGRALYAYDWVSDAARRGTRYAMVRGTGSCTGSPELTDCNAGPTQITTYV
jgi:Flp pilus assembly protein TadG